MTRKPLNTLQAGRAFAAIAVLLFHVNLVLALPQYVGRLLHPVFSSGYSGVHFFFVLSGFVIMLAHGRDIGRPARIGVFAWKRFRRIYPPMWAALLLVLPLVLALPEINHWAPLDAAGLLSAIALTPASSEAVLTVAWTLRHEVLFYAVFGLMIWKPRLGIAVAATWLALSAILPWFDLGYPLRFFFTSQHLLFAFGAVAFVLFERRLARWPLVMMLAGLTLFAATWAIPLLKLPLHGIVGNWAFGLGATLAVLGAATLERDRGLPVPRPLIFLGEASYAIYLVHSPIVHVAAALLERLPPGARPPAEATFWIVAAVALLAGVAFHLAIERPILGWLARKRPAPAADVAQGPALP